MIGIWSDKITIGLNFVLLDVVLWKPLECVVVVNKREKNTNLQEEEEAEVQDSSCGCQVDDHESTPESHCCSGNLQSCNILLTGDPIADQPQLLPSLDTRKKLPPLASLHHASCEFKNSFLPLHL